MYAPGDLNTLMLNINAWCGLLHGSLIGHIFFASQHLPGYVAKLQPSSVAGTAMFFQQDSLVVHASLYLPCWSHLF
jgi:hypothetical protein